MTVAGVSSPTARSLRKTTATVNGGPGLLFTVGGKPVEVLTFAAGEDAIDAVYVILNPDKLARWAGEATPDEEA